MTRLRIRTRSGRVGRGTAASLHRSLWWSGVWMKKARTAREERRHRTLKEASQARAQGRRLKLRKTVAKRTSRGWWGF